MIIDNVTSEIVGNVGFQGVPKEAYPGMPLRAFLAYALIPSARGKGIATITSQAMIKWAFENGVSAVDGMTHYHNDASHRVCERLGFKVTNIDGNCMFWELKKPD
jgi:RimJ/RimL family protein N-acetyltransferase